MKQSCFFVISVFVMLALLSSVSYAIGPATSQWPMFRHNPRHYAVSQYGDPAPGGPAWKNVIGGGLSSPVIAPDGTIYMCGGSGYLYALNPNGSVKWTRYIGGTTRSTPAIADDGTVYIGGADKKVYAVNPNNSIKWTYLTGSDISSSPAIGADGTVYIGSKDAYLYALNPVTGARAWRFNTGGTIHMCSPSVGSDGTVYIAGASGNLHAVNPVDGTEVWRFVTGDTIMSSPALSHDGSRVYIGSCDGYLYAVNTADGSRAWAVTVPLVRGSTSSSPAVAPDGTIYVGSNGASVTQANGTLFAISPAGAVLWQFETAYDIRSSPAVSAGGTIYIGVMDGYVYALNPDGTKKWQYLGNGGIYGSPAVAANGSVVVQTIGGAVYGNLTTTPPPAVPPSNLTVSLLTDDSVRLAWQDNSNGEYGFNIQRKLGVTGTYAYVGQVGANVTTFDDTGLGSGLTYYYRVCAYQEAGDSAFSNEVSVLMPGLPAPMDLIATPISGTQVDLAWSDLSVGELGFRIERMQGPVGPFRQVASVGPNITTYSDLSVNPAINYYYRVRSYDATRDSSPSNEAWAATPGYDYSNVIWGNTSRPQMALTFDAGTAAIKPEILNTLREKKVYCNFFLTGYVTQQQSALARQIVYDGHLMCNHSLDHPSFVHITDAEIARQLSTTDEIIYGTTGHRTRQWFRTPYGAYNEHVLSELEENGYRHVFWSADSGDAGGATTQQIINNIVSGASNGAVALMHCTVANTAAALPTIIDQIRAQGLELVTVPELVAPLQVTSPPEAVAPGWNFISLPIDPANTTPAVVFRGLDIDGKLFRFDNSTQSMSLFDGLSQEAFGQMSIDEGYWLYMTAPGQIRFNGYPLTEDRHIKLPPALGFPDQAWSIIGYPFQTAQPLANCSVFNPNASEPKTRSIAEARNLGWVSSTLYVFDSPTQSMIDVGLPEDYATLTDLMPWHGYWFMSNLNELELIIPLMIP